MLDSNDYLNQPAMKALTLRYIAAGEETLAALDQLKRLKEFRAQPASNVSNVVIASLLARQRECYEGNHAVSRIGRCVAAQALLRMQYETWLNSLFFAYGHGSEVERQAAGLRFMGCAARARVDAMQSVVSDLIVEGKKRGMTKSEAKAFLESVRKQHAKWLKHAPAGEHWHGLKDTRALKDSLWPNPGMARFPDIAFGARRQTWDGLFTDAWKQGSGHVHGVPASALLSVGRSRDGWVSDAPIFSPIPIRTGTTILALHCQSVADWYGLTDEWEAFVGDSVDRFEEIHRDENKLVEENRRIVGRPASASKR